MSFLDRILRAVSFAGVCVVVLGAPWFFGAWEQWWFWPFVAWVFLSALGFAGQVVVSAFMRERQHPSSQPFLARRSHWAKTASPEGESAGSTPVSPKADSAESSAAALGGAAEDGRVGDVWPKLLAVLAFLPFLIYGFIRFLQADVFMDAQRSFLLYLTASLLAVQVAFGFGRKRAALLFGLMLADLALLAAYGLGNHALTGSRLVMWCPGYPQYAGRLTGTYYCPDHFSGLMELGFCLCLALLLTRLTDRRRRTWAALLAIMALVVVVLSKSRGGGLTVLAALAAALVWGFSQWPRAVRWWLRVAAACLGVLALMLFVRFAPGYMARFNAYFGWNESRSRPFEEVKQAVSTRLEATDRVQMAAAALRAWRTAPWRGIGPGMHQNLWPHFAATPDGDRQMHRWPTHPNFAYHSYEVHSDWVQFLEEYGAVGFALFLLAAGVVFGLLARDLRAQSRELEANDWQARGDEPHAFVLSGLLAIVCMGFHSLGDFNLQIPATTWLLAAILGVAGAHLGETEAQ